MMLPPFQELVDAHWRDVARLCVAIAGPDDGADAAQSTWLQALNAYSALSHAGNLRGWVLTIAARAATDRLRERGRRPTPLAQLPDGAAPTAEPLPYDGGVWDEVRALPERQRVAVALRYVADLQHADIAAVLETTPTATRRLVSDALATLRQNVSQEVHS